MKIVAAISLFMAVIALFFAYGFFSWIGKTNSKTERIKDILHYIKKDSNSFIKREGKAMSIFSLLFFIVLGIGVNWISAALFVIGVIFSFITVLWGLRSIERGSERATNEAIREDADHHLLKVIYRSGAVLGLCILGLGLLGVGGTFFLQGVKPVSTIAGFGFGTSFAAIFHRIGGGIFANAAAAPERLLKKRESAFSAEDQNRILMTERTGANTRAAAALGSDLFESYTGAILSAILLAVITRTIQPKFGYPFDLPVLEGMVFPLSLSAAGIIASIAGMMFVRGSENKTPVSSLKNGMYISCFILIIFSLIISRVFFANFNCAFAVIDGLLLGLIFGKITEKFTTENNKQSKDTMKASGNGNASIFIRGYGSGIYSAVLLMLLMTVGIFAAHGFAGFYGIALAAMGMLSTSAVVFSASVFEVIPVNAERIAGMAKLTDVRGVTDSYHLTGSKKSSYSKAYAAGSAIMTALALVFTYTQIMGMKMMNFMKPGVFAGLFLGALLPFLFAAMSIYSADRTANRFTNEMYKPQGEASEGVSDRLSLNDKKWLDFGVKESMKDGLRLGLMGVLIPVALGVSMGTEVLGGILAGSICAGSLLAFMTINTGSIWTNAFDSTDLSSNGMTNNLAYHQVEIGNIIGALFKNAAGPSIYTMIKLMAISAVAFSPLITLIRNLL